MSELAGRRALVTGASRGIGREIALGFARAGADVALLARSAEPLAELAAQVSALGRRVVVLPADVTDPAAVDAAVRRTVAELGGLDVVVNNAGGTSFVVPFLAARPDGWAKVTRLNVDSVLHVCRAVGPHLLEQGSGSVINVASVAGLAGVPGLAPYGAAKAAVVSLTRTLAVEWAPAGVRVNALCPGWTATELNRGLWEDPAASAELLRRVPMGRWGAAAELVGPAVFLAGEASSFMTGQVLVVDGGLTAG